MKPIATQNALINGSRVAYGVYGSDAGEPVVLLHGTPSSSLIWRNVVPKLVEAGYKAHVFDLLGYGVSERPWDSSVDTSMTGQVTVLEGLLSTWGFDETTSVHVVAHDIGGGIAQRFAVFSPHRVRSLTLIDVVSFDSYPSKRTREQMDKGLEKLVKASDEEHREHFREWLLSTVVNEDQLPVDDYLGYISGPIGQPSLFEHQVRHYDPRHTMEVADRLHELGGGGGGQKRMPVQIIWGKEDRWQVVDWAYRLNKAIPGSRLDVLDGAGHFSPEDQPGKVADVVIRFLKGGWNRT
ncbi:alpha/beta hydrolase fold protein [Poronia punctata]|nr:alpha/beta hydrolase fold protein [Poronia punctata]